jgi:uncharacterized Zn finger protein
VNEQVEYPCPDCGADGPHLVVEQLDDGTVVAECGSCYIEFDVPA